MTEPSQIGVYIIRITLLGFDTKIWRNIVIPADIDLARLHIVLQVAMGWSNSHLHAFVAGEKQYGVPDPDFDDPLIDQSGKKLSQLLKKPKDKIRYDYDFGDNWEHDLVLLEAFKTSPYLIMPVCIDGEMTCPPEDVGGVRGYVRFLDIMAIEDHPEHDEYVEWIGGEWDPDDFDIWSTNVLLGRAFPKGL